MSESTQEPVATGSSAMAGDGDVHVDAASEPGRRKKDNWWWRMVARLTPNKHTAAERSLRSILVVGVSLILVVFGSAFSSIQRANADLGSTSMYAQTFKTSRTGVTGTVENVYTDANRTRAFVLVKFDDITQVSTDASKYQAFVTGSDPNGGHHTLKSSPSGSIYVFGSTGYMGIYLVNGSGFPSQVMHLTVRANAELVSAADVPSENLDAGQNDSSFAEYDQFNLYVNPGASGTKAIPAMNASTPDVRNMYDEMVTQPQEASVHKKLNDDLTTMRADLSQITEYTSRLNQTSVNGVHVIVPDAPKPIKGDKIQCYVSDHTSSSTPTASATNINTCPLQLVTDHVLARGYDFDWRAKSVSDGYLSDLVPSDQTYVTYLAAKAQAEDDQIDTSDTNWSLSDGSRLDDYTADSVPAIKSIQTNASLLTSAWQTYAQDKANYQETDLGALLNLEVELDDVATNSTVNATSKALLSY